MSRYIDQLVNEQIRRSELARLKMQENNETCISNVITISRTMGSGARIVAQKVSQDLGLSLWGKELIDYIAKEADISQRIVEEFDEKAISEFQLFARAAFGDHEVGGFIFGKHLSSVVEGLSKLGNTIILGRGANFILPDALHIRIDASFDFRVRNMTIFEGLSRSQAEAKLRASDKERKHFLVSNFGKTRVSEVVYDLSLWMDNFSIEGAAEIVEAAIADRCKYLDQKRRSEPSKRVRVVQSI